MEMDHVSLCSDAAVYSLCRALIGMSSGFEGFWMMAGAVLVDEDDGLRGLRVMKRYKPWQDSGTELELKLLSLKLDLEVAVRALILPSSIRSLPWQGL